MSTVVDIRPDLAHIRLGDRVAGREVEEALMRFKNLHTLCMKETSDRMWCALSTLEHLQTFQCDSLRRYGEVDGPYAAGFPVLETLSLPDNWSYHDDKFLPTFIKMLLSITSARLTSITFSFPRTSRHATIYEGVGRLGKHAAFQQLCHLDLTVRFDWWGIGAGDGVLPAETVAFADLFRPFLPLHDIRTFRLVVYGMRGRDNRCVPCTLSNEDIADIARAWPQLVVLRIKDHSIHRRNTPPCSGPKPKRPSLFTLVSLAETCRGLEELDVDFADMTENEVRQLEVHAGLEGSISVTSGRQMALRKLLPEFNFVMAEGVCFSRRCGDISLFNFYTRVVKALGTLFPNLEKKEGLLSG